MWRREVWRRSGSIERCWHLPLNWKFKFIIRSRWDDDEMMKCKHKQRQVTKNWWWKYTQKWWPSWRQSLPRGCCSQFGDDAAGTLSNGWTSATTTTTTTTTAAAATVLVLVVVLSIEVKGMAATAAAAALAGSTVRAAEEISGAWRLWIERAAVAASCSRRRTSPRLLWLGPIGLSAHRLAEAPVYIEGMLGCLLPLLVDVHSLTLSFWNTVLVAGALLRQCCTRANACST